MTTKAKKRRITQEEFAQALTKSHGFLSGAATLLGCDRRTIYRAIERSPTLKTHVNDLREKRLDFAEGVLMKLMQEGNVAAVIFFLKTQGRERGYTERLEVSGPSEELTAFTAQLAAARAAHGSGLN